MIFYVYSSILVYMGHQLTDRIYTQLTPLSPVYIRKCSPKYNIQVFSHQVTNDLMISIPYSWKHSDLTFHFSLRGYILSYLEALKEEDLWDKTNYSGTVPRVLHTWVCIPLSLEKPLVLLPKLAFVLWACLDMEDWSGGGPGGGLGFLISTRCRQRLSFVSMLIFNRNIHFSSIICVTMNIFIHGCSWFDYILDFYIL